VKHLLFTFLLFFISSCDSSGPPTTYPVSVSSSPDTAATVYASKNEAEEGTQVQIQAQVNEGWRFTGWTGNLSEQDELETTVTVDSEINATAQFNRKEHELSVSTEGEGSVTEEVVKTKDTYEHGTVVRLTAKPDSGWVFAEWSGAISDTANSVEVNVEEEISVIATFEKQRHSLETNTDGSGSVNRVLISGDRGPEGYTHGSEIELTASPAENWIFSHWQGSLSGTQSPGTLVIDEDEAVTAIFSELHSVSTSTEGEGNVSTDPSGEEQPEGTTVAFEAQSDQGWKFDHWEGDISGSENPDSLEISSPVSVTAVFKQEQYTVNVGKSGQGTIDYAPQKQTYVYGDTIALEASPEVSNPETSEDAWELARWEGTQLSGYEPTLTVTSSADIEAVFQTYEQMIEVGFWNLGCMNECFDRLEVNLQNGLRRAIFLDQVILYDETGTSIKAVSLNVLLLPGEDSNGKTPLTAFDLDDPPGDRETVRDYTTEWRIQYTRPDGVEVAFDHFIQVSELFCCD